MATYKVKKGDTLSAIAKQLGTTIDQLSGYRSGDPNKIFEGETITTGAGNSQNTAQERASAIGTAFGSTGDKSSTTGTTEAPKGAFKADSIYDSAGYKTKADTAKAKKDEIFGKIQNFESTRYNEEYDKSGLADKKSKISALDSEIATAKQELNDSLAKVRSNPGASAATITGEVSVISDKLGKQIQNKIDERNSIADEYNTGVSEIKDRVKTELSDLEKEYNFYAKQEEEANTNLKSYQDAVIEELKTADTQEFQLGRDDLQFARDLALAREKGTGSNGLTTTQLFDRELKLAGNYEKYAADANTAIRQAGIAKTAYNEAIRNLSANKPLGAQSQALITAFNKMIDPTSVVRESEYARTPEGSSLLNRLDGAIIRLQQGGVGLNKAELDNIFNTVDALLSGYRQQQQNYAKLIANQAQSIGADLSRVLPPDVLQAYQNGGQTGNQAPSGVSFNVEAPALPTGTESKPGVLSSIGGWLKGLFK